MLNFEAVSFERSPHTTSPRLADLLYCVNAFEHDYVPVFYVSKSGHDTVQLGLGRQVRVAIKWLGSDLSK